MIGRMVDDVRKRLERCIAEGLIPADVDLGQAASMLLSAVHGPAVIGLTGRPPSESLDTIARDLLDAAILGLQSGIARRTEAEPVGPAVPA